MERELFHVVRVFERQSHHRGYVVGKRVIIRETHRVPPRITQLGKRDAIGVVSRERVIVLLTLAAKTGVAHKEALGTRDVP